MLTISEFIVLTCAFGIIAYLINIFITRKARRNSDQELKAAARIRTLSNDFTKKHTEFMRLGEIYFIEKKHERMIRRQDSANQAIKTGSPDSIARGILLYEDILQQLERYLENPDNHFERKFYDFLDDSVLTDPVNLTINHPAMGPVTLRVNRKNAEKYKNPLYGPKSFRMNSKRTKTHNYLVRPKNTGTNINHYDMYDDGFGILDYIILCELLFDGNQDGYIQDVGFSGGEFNGAGASGDYYVETEAMQDPATTDPDSISEVAPEHNADPLIIDPFVQEDAQAEDRPTHDLTENGIAETDAEYSAGDEPAESQDFSGTSY